MIAPGISGARGRAAEALQVVLALAVVYCVVAALDVALFERLTNGAEDGRSSALACVMSGPLSERVQAGRPMAASSIAASPVGGEHGELRRALARVRGRVGSLTGGVRMDGVSYAAVDGIAELVGADLHQSSSSATAQLICPHGLIEIIPLSRTARRNLRPVKLPQVTRVIDDRLYVPVRGLDELAPVEARWDEQSRSWHLRCGERTMRVAAPQDLFEIEIDRSDRTLAVSYAGERLVRWSCCVGAGGNTPVGSFHIRNKARWAPWRAYWGEYIPGGSPRNPLGARWLGTSARGRETGRAIGIHGTNQPSSIGRRISGGCVRLTNAHAIEMYDTIPIGTRVIIHE